MNQCQSETDDRVLVIPPRNTFSSTLSQRPVVILSLKRSRLEDDETDVLDEAGSKENSSLKSSLGALQAELSRARTAAAESQNRLMLLQAAHQQEHALLFQRQAQVREQDKEIIRLRSLQDMFQQASHTMIKGRESEIEALKIKYAEARKEHEQLGVRLKEAESEASKLKMVNETLQTELKAFKDGQAAVSMTPRVELILTKVSSLHGTVNAVEVAAADLTKELTCAMATLRNEEAMKPTSG